MREDGFFAKVFEKGTPQCAAMCSLLGLMTALLLLWGGVWKTLLVAALIGLGVFVGGVKDKKAFLRKIMNAFVRP